MMIDDKEILRMALVGYRVMVMEASEKISEIEVRLRGGEPQRPMYVPSRHMSAATREKMRKSQQARWAAKRRAA